mmetsp:Transcript_26525/g.44327  ORF Transcript_26525/g.44327 Transcript_26525/m.44327 type:complete len:99 (+) Transcript_26525:2-298(+)
MIERQEISAADTASMSAQEKAGKEEAQDEDEAAGGGDDTAPVDAFGGGGGTILRFLCHVSSSLITRNGKGASEQANESHVCKGLESSKVVRARKNEFC